jgi:small subunit ribosomal protein S13
MEEQKQKEKKEKKPQQKQQEENRRAEVLIRIFSTDVPGNFSVYHGLTRVKGVSWAMSNAICNSLDLEKKKKMQELSESDIEKINNFIKNPKIPEWLLNRRKDEETGESKHLITSDLDLARDFDIRKMKKIKSYRGWRHATGQPVRGQRTKSHFRHGGAMGVMKSKQAKSTAAAAGKK